MGKKKSEDMSRWRSCDKRVDGVIDEYFLLN